MRWPDGAPDRARNAPTSSERAVDLAWARAALTGALDEELPPVPEFPPHASFGDYELLRELGRGATGVVYRARQRSDGQTVALKLMNDADFASDEELRRFRFGAEAAAELDHPNIVPVLQVGEQQGRPFFTMRLLEGGSLADALPRFCSSQLGAAQLIAKVAAAVHHAHQRGVLHRDLKPENIVLDERDEPHVADFGLAKRLDARASARASSAIVGSADYMAPEQAAGNSRKLTFAADIYSLGAIFYELLTGEVPVQGESLAEVLEKLRSPESVRPLRQIDACIDWELELVCLKCLEKDPAQRYGTAAELAVDLERWLRFEPVTVTARRPGANLWRWCRSHPVFATVLSGALIIGAASATVGVSIAREQEEALRREVLHVNAYAAQAKAGQVLVQLRELSHPVARCAADPRIVDSITTDAEGAASPVNSERLLIECGAKAVFDSVSLLDTAGVVLARAPRSPADAPGGNLSYRDDFLGAKRLGESGYRSVHVARVQRSETDGLLQVALAAPLFDDENKWRGVVAVQVGMNAFLETLRLRDDGRQWAVLAGVRDRGPDRAGASARDAMILLDDRLQSGPAAAAPDRWLVALSHFKERANAFGRDQFRFAEPQRTLEEDYKVESSVGGRWLAGFAPVGDTGYAVIVQTHYDTALDAPKRAFLRVAGWSGSVLALGTALLLSIALLLRARQRGGSR